MTSKNSVRAELVASELLKQDAGARKKLGVGEITSGELKARFPKLDEPVKEAVVRLIEERS